MLWFERQVVGTLMTPNVDAATRRRIEEYVDHTLASMPEHLRLGVAAESVLFGSWSRLEASVGRLDAAKLEARVQRFKASRIDVIRQYLRLLEGLVLFAENEFAPAA